MPHSVALPSRVTLLGDAVHAKSPTVGRRANLAMRDGALHGRALAAVTRGRLGLGPALAAYERDMVGHGFSVVIAAAYVGQQRMTQNPSPV